MWFMEIEDVVQAKSRLLLMWKKRGHDPFLSASSNIFFSSSVSYLFSEPICVTVSSPTYFSMFSSFAW